MSEISEHTIRMRVYALELRPNTKLTLLGVLARVNWSTWSGAVSARVISRTVGVNERTVKRSIKELIDLGFIQRVQAQAQNGRDTSAETQINVDLIMSTSQGESVTVSQGESVTMTRGGCHHDTGRVSPCHRGGDTQTPHVCDTQTPLTIQSIEQPTSQPTSQPREEPRPKATALNWGGPILPSSTPITNRSSYR